MFTDFINWLGNLHYHSTYSHTVKQMINLEFLDSCLEKYCSEKLMSRKIDYWETNSGEFTFILLLMFEMFKPSNEEEDYSCRDWLLYCTVTKKTYLFFSQVGHVGSICRDSFIWILLAFPIVWYTSIVLSTVNSLLEVLSKTEQVKVYMMPQWEKCHIVYCVFLL